MGTKNRGPSIIRRTCAFDSKIRVFLEVSEFVSAYIERDKNFFRKILFFHFLLSFLFENQSDFACFNGQKRHFYLYNSVSTE